MGKGTPLSVLCFGGCCVNQTMFCIFHNKNITHILRISNLLTTYIHEYPTRQKYLHQTQVTTWCILYPPTRCPSPKLDSTTASDGGTHRYHPCTPAIMLRTMAMYCESTAFHFRHLTSNSSSIPVAHSCNQITTSFTQCLKKNPQINNLRYTRQYLASPNPSVISYQILLRLTCIFVRSIA